MWCGSTFQSRVEEAPKPGIRNLADGPRYSIARAAPHQASRVAGSARPPAIQQAPETESHARMRRKLRPCGVAAPNARTA